MIKKIKYLLNPVIIVAIIFLIYLSPLDTFWRNEEPVRIYFADHISEAHKTIINKFNKLNKGEIEIIPIHIPFEKFTTNERKEIISRNLRGSDGLDIIAIDQIWIPRFSKWGAPLDIYFNENEIGNILPQAISPCYINGHLMAVPIQTDISVMYYRKDLLKKNFSEEVIKEIQSGKPITWEYLSELNKIKKTKTPLFIFTADDYEGLVCSYIENLHQLGGKLIENGKLKLTSPASVEALKILKRLFTEGITPDTALSFRENSAFRYFAETGAVFNRGWPSLLYDYNSLFADTGQSGNIGIMPLPFPETGTQLYITGGWHIMISANSKKKDESAEFVRYLLSEESQKTLYEKRGHIPVNMKVLNNDSYNINNSDIPFYKKLIEKGTNRPAIENYTKISAIISYYIVRTLKNELDPETALAIAEQKILYDEIPLR